ncbi:hypothetical protein IEQ34_011365 [Dendrobium chrysotoxum]|uniref:Exopolygalacturonase n=1 Tax=Dendrobium chrysotoxum TaxID=161865 RepID=A0AAV7GXJ7_DENCH|nr:hypothetical protein IEQ34_011365 [Dendrobium chrysotoxum]
MALQLLTSFLPLLLLLCFTNLTMAAYSILSFGAKPDGWMDSAPALLAAWGKACGDNKPATLVVPKGYFLVSRALFQGPCKNNIRLLIHGTIVGDSAYSAASEWITFKYVEGLSLYSATFDARGQSLWSCKAAKRSCPTGSTALTISQSKNVTLSGVTVKNSENFQIAIMFSQGVRVEGATVTAPVDSPNTDGIHVHMSSLVSITNSTIRTGDDCISLGTGVTNISVQDIRCGPGHGISIGSLGGSPGDTIVQNVTVSSVILTGTQNGLRIKTWANPYDGFVSGIIFRHAIMNNVQNPIIIDQNYCPGNANCPNQSSGIKISGVQFDDVKGSSATAVAVKLDCSRSNPCSGIEFTSINLSYNGNKRRMAESFCRNVEGSSSGLVNPPSCL